MRNLLLSIVMLLPLLWGCNNENEQISKKSTEKLESTAGPLSRATSSGLGVNNQILFLLADTTEHAGQIVVTANVPEVSLAWNVREESNLDTSCKSLEIVNGQAVFDIKWAKKSINGNFAPAATAFDNGVRISDGTTSIYVHLVLTENPNIDDFAYLLDIPSSQTPVPNLIQISPATLDLTAQDGGIAYLMLVGTAPIQMQTEEIGSFTKLNLSLIPEFIEEDGNSHEIPFKWKTTVPDANFKVLYSVFSFDTYLTAEAELSYIEQSEDFLTATPDTIKVSDAGGSTSVKVETNQDKWILQNATEIPAWLTCGNMEGGKGTSVLNLTVAASQSTQSRSYKLYLKAGNLIKEINVIQLSLVPSLDVSPISFADIKAEGENVNVTVNSNVDWKLTENMPAWLQPDILSGSGNKTIVFTAAPHDAFEPRTAKIAIMTTVGETPIQKEIAFTQNAREFKVSPVLFPNIKVKGETVDVNIISNINWQLSQDIPSWIHPKKQNGVGSATVAFEIDANNAFTSRTAVVKIFTMAGTTEVSKEVKFTQGPREFNLSPAVFSSISPEGETLVVNVTSNVNWEVSDNLPSWLHSNVKSGSDNGAITFTVAPNNTATSRTESVKIFTLVGGTEVSKTITFQQQSMGLTVSPESYLNISDNGDVLTLTVASNVSWQISGGIPSWLHADTQMGIGNAIVSFTVDSNNTFLERNARVTLTTLTGTTVISREVTFTQKAKQPYLTVSQSSFNNVSAFGKRINVDVSSNTAWEVINSNSWIQVSPANGSGNQTLRLTVSRNRLAARTGTVTIRTINGGETVTKTVAITQKGLLGSDAEN